MNYAQALEFILSLPDMERFDSGPGSRVMSLETMRSLLGRLHDPHRGRKTVHITGSKGKGSTSSFIASILSQAGVATGLYTSPHLGCYRERIAVNLRALSEEQFARGLETVRPAIEAEHAGGSGPVSTFGAMNALFFHSAREHKADFQVVEVGLGGTYDGTNVFDLKEVAVVTAISLEHTAILGDSPAKIAANKAGIIVPGCLTVLARQRDPSVKAVIAERCAQVGSELVDVAQLYSWALLDHDRSGQTFVLRGPHGEQVLSLSMLGAHQLDNAVTAVAVVEALNKRQLPVTSEQIKRGLATVRLPGRLELISMVPPVVVDGAHNGESMENLCRALRLHFPAERYMFVLGVNADKDLGGMLNHLSGMGRTIVCTRSGSARALDPGQIAGEARKVGLETIVSESVAEAVDQALRLRSADEVICVTGSLHVAAEARAHVLAAASS